MERIRSARLCRTEFYSIPVRVADEELRIARPPAAVTDRYSHLAKLFFGSLNVLNAERDMTVVARRIGVSGHFCHAHQMKLLSIAQIVPSTGKSQIGTRQGYQPKGVFVKIRRAFDLSDQKTGVMKTRNIDWHIILHLCDCAS